MRSGNAGNGSPQTVSVFLLRWTGSKNPTHSCPGDRWKWSAFYAIAEFLEFPHHACGARAFGLGTHRWPPFLVADPLMEDHPQHSAESMGDGPDGLLVPQTR